MDLTQLAIADPITAPFWQGAARRKLMIQRCVACGHHQFYPRQFCLACDADAPAWVEASGKGRVYTRTVIRRAPSPSVGVPYANALIDLDEGVRFFAGLADTAIGIGERVSVAWRERADGAPLPFFERAEG